MKKKESENIVGENIKRLRRKNGWSQAEAARKIDISIPAFSKIETGITDMNMSRLLQVAELLSVSVYELMSPDGEGLNLPGVDEVDRLNARIAEMDSEINKISKMLIDLYEEVRRGN